MIIEHQQEREQTEQQIWDDIDRLRETNREELAILIDKGIQEKGKLQLIKSEFDKKTGIKETLNEEIKKLNGDLQKLFKQTEAHKQNINSQKSELGERQTTISDKDSRIQALKLKT